MNEIAGPLGHGSWVILTATLGLQNCPLGFIVGYPVSQVAVIRLEVASLRLLWVILSFTLRCNYCVSYIILLKVILLGLLWTILSPPILTFVLWVTLFRNKKI